MPIFTQIAQPLQRQFFTTNTAPNVVPTAGSNAFVTFSLVGQERRYRIDVPASGTATNVVWPVQGTNVVLTTNGLQVVIDVPTQQIPWQAISNIVSIQIPYSAITNPPAAGGQTNLALVVAGTNVFVTAVTNTGVTTFTIDVPTPVKVQFVSDISTNQIPWQSVSNIATVQIPAAAVTNAPWSTTGQTNLALVVSGTNAFVTATTNSGVTTFTVDGPALQTQWPLSAVTNAANLTNWALLSTNTFLNKAGDTSTGPQLTTSSTSNSPSATEFATAGWVRSLLNNGFFEYASTNIISGTNADSPNQFLYAFQSTIPNSAVRVWTSAFLTNNGYVGSVATTNTFQSLAGSVVVNAYMGLSSGGGDALSIKPEIYLSTDRTNWYGDFDCQPQALTPGRTNLYTFVITFPAQTATNAAGFYLERRLKVTSVGGTPTLTFMVGTNAVSGTNNASHTAISASTVQATAGFNTTNAQTMGAIPYAASATEIAWLPQNSITVNPGSRAQVPVVQGGSLTMTPVSQYGFRKTVYWCNNSSTLIALSDSVNLAPSANSAYVAATATSHSAVTRFTAATTANTNAVASSSWVVPAKSGFFSWSMYPTNGTANTLVNARLRVGLTSAATGGAYANSETNAATHVVEFIGSATNWANWQFANCDNNASNWHWTDTGVSLATAITNFTIILNGNGSVMTSAVGLLNGIPVATNASNLPSAPMKCAVGIATLADDAAGFALLDAIFEQDK